MVNNSLKKVINVYLLLSCGLLWPVPLGKHRRWPDPNMSQCVITHALVLELADETPCLKEHSFKGKVPPWFVKGYRWRSQLLESQWRWFAVGREPFHIQRGRTSLSARWEWPCRSTRTWNWWQPRGSGGVTSETAVEDIHHQIQRIIAGCLNQDYDCMKIAKGVGMWVRTIRQCAVKNAMSPNRFMIWNTFQVFGCP